MSEKLKLCICAGPHFGVLLLQKILEKGEFDIVVVTYRSEYDDYYGYYDVINLCIERNIPYLDVSKSRKAMSEFILSQKPDLILCGYFDKIIPENIFSSPRLGCYNIHPGLLPRYRGPFPTAWALLNKESTIGITVHLIDNGIDTGNIYRQITIPVNMDDTGYSLYIRSMEVGAEMYAQMLSEGIDTSPQRVLKIQEGVQSYFGMIESHYKIDWRQSSCTIVQLVKIHARPYFPAFAFVKNNLVLFNSCREYSGTDLQLQGPGIIRKINQDGTFIVSCGEGFLEVMDYTLAVNNENRLDFIRLNAKLF